MRPSRHCLATLSLSASGTLPISNAQPPVLPVRSRPCQPMTCDATLGRRHIPPDTPRVGVTSLALFREGRSKIGRAQHRARRAALIHTRSTDCPQPCPPQGFVRKPAGLRLRSGERLSLHHRATVRPRSFRGLGRTSHSRRIPGARARSWGPPEGQAAHPGDASIPVRAIQRGRGGFAQSAATFARSSELGRTAPSIGPTQPSSGVQQRAWRLPHSAFGGNTTDSVRTLYRRPPLSAA